MPILGLGVSHRHAPVDLLERLSFADDEYPKAYRRLLELPAVAGGVILSTCNRVEVYAEVTAYHPGFLDLKRFLSESREVDADTFAEPLAAHYEEDAAGHLFEVAAGLDSMVLGEPQILAQVRAAFRRSQQEGAAGPTVSALLRGAIRAGRRVRAETAIGASPGAFVEAGTRVARELLGPPASWSVLVVGAGGMGGLAATHLRAQGVATLRIVNRNAERAARLAARVGGEPAGLEALASAVARADLVVSSTGAPGTVIPRGLVADALARRPIGAEGMARPIVLLDLAVPRDVEPSAASLPGVRLIDIDRLGAEVGGAGIPAEVARAREIASEEVRRFSQWRRAARLAPLIQGLRDRGAAVQAAELARAAPRLAELDEREWAAVRQLAEGIVAKLLHDPMVRLKQRPGPSGEALARTVAELFGIDYDPRSPEAGG